MVCVQCGSKAVIKSEHHHCESCNIGGTPVFDASSDSSRFQQDVKLLGENYYILCDRLFFERKTNPEHEPAWKKRRSSKC